ncbi:MAG: NAD-dependent epimerase/dehydratase family protein [Solirubrobacteraceae bacterium]
MRLLVTGATGYLGWRATVLLRARGHDVLALTRPGHAVRDASRELDAVQVDAGDPAAREHIAGRHAVLHFAGVPDPARAAADPARAIRENAGTTFNLLEGCREHGAGLVYPSTIRATEVPAPDPYAASKRLGEEACRLHAARSTVVRLTSVFGPGQVAWEGATGAIASFAARALEGGPIVVRGNPHRTRDFVYVDDLVLGLEALLERGSWEPELVAASDRATSLLEAAEVVRDSLDPDCPIELPEDSLPPGEDESYAPDPLAPRLGFDNRPLAEAISLYVDWLRTHAPAQGRARG